MKRLRALSWVVLMGLSAPLAALADTTYTFVNNSPYTLTFNNIQQQSNANCLSSQNQFTQNQSGNCQAILSPSQQQQFSINPGGNMTVTWYANTPTANYNGVYTLQLSVDQNGQLTYKGWGRNYGQPIPYTNLSFDGSNTVTFASTQKMPIPTLYSQNDMPLRGVALSGAETGSTFTQGQYTETPSNVDAAPFVKAGMNTIRFPINWNFLFVQNNGTYAIDPLYEQTIVNQTQQFLKAGFNVIFDVHDYMRYAPNQPAQSGNVVSTTQIFQMWSNIATILAPLATQYDGQHGASNQLIFEIMNEPNSMPTQQVLDNSNSAISAIRQVRQPNSSQPLANLILIEGNNWSGLHSWTNMAGQDGKTNAQVFVAGSIVDPVNHYAIAVHQYFDDNGYQGTMSTCQSLSQFQAGVNLPAFIQWMQQNKMPVILDEFGSGPTSASNPNCGQDVNWLLQQMAATPYKKGQGGFIGWTAWNGGHGYVLQQGNDVNNMMPSCTQQNGKYACTPSSQMSAIYDGYLTPPPVTTQQRLLP